MRAILVKEHGSPEDMILEDLPTPKPGPGEVLIDIHAIGLNFSDLLVINGQYQSLPPLPFVPGKEVAGLVAAVGEGVSHRKPGDRVMARLNYGGYAEQTIAQELNCFVFPESMSFSQAAAMGTVYQTAHFALIERAQYAPGETVLVTGASGGVGLAAVQLAKALGATALAGVSSPEKAEVARAGGADHIIDLAAVDLKESVRAQVREATDGRGANVVLDPVGGEVFEASLRALAWQGRIVVIGFTAGNIPAVKTNYLLVKNISVTGLHLNTYFAREPARVQRIQEELFDLFLEGKIEPRVMKAFPMERFAEALKTIQERRVWGKIVLTTGRETK